MKKKMAMLLALAMTVTSIEGSAFAVRGADFSSEPVRITEEAEPQAGGEENFIESFGVEEIQPEEESPEASFGSVEEALSGEGVNEEVFSSGTEEILETETEAEGPDELEVDEDIVDGKNETENIIVDSETELFSDSGELQYGNFIYTVIEDTAEAKITGYVGQEVSIEIPESIDGHIVTEIGSSAFYGCTNLERVEFPSQLKEIGNDAFERCTNLERVEFPSQLKKIGNDAFSECNKLKDVVLPEGLEVIGHTVFTSSYITGLIIPSNVTNTYDTYGESPFCQCEKLETVIFAEGRSEIPDRILEGCQSVKTIVLPEGITSIGFMAFRGIGIETVELPNSLERIEGYAFGECEKLEEIVIPANVKEIGDFVFNGCNKLKDVVLPEGLEGIGSGVFTSPYITSLTIPSNVTTTSSSSPFYQCKKLETVIFAEGRSEIPDRILANCQSVKTIVLPEGITSLGTFAFYNTGIETVELPNSLERIGGAFCKCEKLKEIVIPANVKEIESSSFGGCTNLERVEFPSQLKEIEEHAFERCTNLERVEFPSQLKEIGKYAFSGCNKLKDVVLPEGLEVIGHSVFTSPYITGLIIPSNVTNTYDTYGESPFFGCKKLETVIFAEGRSEIPDRILEGCQSVKTIVLPEGITSIGFMAFRGIGIETVELPNSLERIEYGAFWLCEKLKEIVIPANVKEIETQAFFRCTNLERVEFPSQLKEIEAYAFDKCNKLKDVVLPEGLEVIGDSVFTSPYIAGLIIPSNVTTSDRSSPFYECEKLETVIFAEGRSNIPDGILEDCKSVKTIVLPEGITRIGFMAFRGIGIETVELPNSLERIEGYAFYECEKLEQIVIPVNVKEIENSAFYGCSKMRAAVIPRSVTRIGEDAFSGSCSDFTIFGYSGSYAETYANSNNIPFVVLDDEEEIERGQGFDLTKDGHCIINDAPYFSYNSWKNWFGIFGYKIPLERYQEVYGDSYTKHIYEQDISTWKGNCFGMSATAVLFYKKKLPVTDYVHNTGTLASGGYDKMASSYGRTYLKLNNDSELTKLIERYQIWQDSSEYFRSYAKDTINYGSGTDAERFSNVVNKIKNTKEPFIVSVNWDKPDGSRTGHALVVDSSRTPQDLGDGWVRIYLYDPNNPYFGSFGDKKPVLYYTQAENRFLDVNISNGQWKMAAALNGNGESITSIGCDDSGNILRNSTIVFVDVNDYPTNFNKKATLSPDKNKTNIAYASDNFEVYDESNKLVYKMEDGKVSYSDDAIVKSFIDCGYIPGMDSGISNGKLMLPRGQYRVEVETGYISYMTDNDYAGIVTKDKAVVKNTDSTSLSVSSTSSNKVNIVIEDAQSDSYTSVETDIVADKNGCEVSLDDKKLNINTENQQQVDVSVIGNGKENEIEDVPIDSTTDIDLNEEHTEHTWDSGKITKKASCTEDGEKIYTCTVCGKTNKTVIPATGQHRLGSWRTTRGATALATGIQERTCSVCGTKQTRAIAKLKPTITLNVPQSKTLPMTLKKSFTVKVSGLAKGDSVKSWSSSNKKIVTVTSKGKMSARKTGTVKITVTLRSGKTAWFKVKVQKTPVKTSKITGISKKVTLNKGKKYTLKPVLTPVTTLDKVKYSTSNKKVATVNSRGLIVAKGAGRATITVTAGSKKAKIVVTVPKVKTTKITGVKTSLTLKGGKSYRIRAKAYPTNTDEKITYTSSNKKIATVTSKGVIKAVKKGKVTITVKSGRKSIKMQLTVK